MTTKVRRIALAVLVVLAATMYAWQQGPGIGTLSNYAAYIYGQVVTGAPFSSNSLGQIFSSPRVIDAAAYCSGGYNASLLSCNGGYDGVHGIGHGMCEAMIAALTVATPNGTGKVDASAFGGIQFITSNCGVLLTYAGGTTSAPGSTVDGRIQLATNVTLLVDGPTTLPFFTDGAVCASTTCAQSGTTAGPSTWATPGFILANQFTGIFGGSKDGTLFIPCSTTVTGCVHDWPSRSFPITSTTVVSNTMTITLAANTLLAGGQNGAGTNSSAVITGFTGSSGTLSFTNSGTNALYAGFSAILFGFTGANVGLNGQTCTISATGLSTSGFQCTVTGSGYSSAGGYISEANIWPTGGGLTGEYGFLVGSSLDNNNSYYIIKTVPTANTITVGVPTGTSSCASNCGTLWLGTAMVGWGMQVTNMAYIPQQGGAGLQSFGQRLEDLGIWGEITQVSQGKQWPFGFIAMQNSNAGENAGAKQVQCDYIGGMCLDLHGGSTDSGPWDAIRMTNLANINAVRSTVGFGVAGAIRGIQDSSVIAPYPVGTVNTCATGCTSGGGYGTCTTNCAQFNTGSSFSTMIANTQINIGGTLYTISAVGNGNLGTNTVLFLTSSAGSSSAVTYQYGQPLACIAVDGQGPTVNQSPYFLGNHPEGCQDGFRLAANYSVRGTTISGFLGGPNGAHANVNIVHAVAAGNTVTGSTIVGIDTQNGGATNTVLDDINGNTCLDLPLALYTWDTVGSPTYACKTGTFGTGVQTLGGIIHSFNATKSTPVGGTAIGGGATTPATSVTTFTFSGFSPNTILKVHCSGTSVMATAGGAGTGIGIAYQTATTATSVDLHGLTATSTTTTQTGATGITSNTGANAIIADATGTVTTPMNWYVDGTIFVGATPPSALNLGFYNINAADTNTIFGSCDVR